MSRSLFHQDVQIHNSETYDDTATSGATMESAPTNIEEDLNNLRAQVKRILNDSAGNWYDDIPTVNAKQRDLTDLNTDLDDLEEKRVLCRATIITDVAVPAAQNYVILSVAGTEAPSQTAAVGAGTAEGATVAESAFSGAPFAAHEVVEIAGPNAIQPKNLAIVRDANGNAISSSNGKEIKALLQVENGTTDGTAFDDTSASARVKLSFVEENATGDDLVLTSVADIQSTTINYAYVFRSSLDNIPEDCFVPLQGFVDQTAAVDVTLDNAIDNQSGDATQDQNIDVNMGAGVFWEWTDDGDATVWRVTEGSAGGTTTVQLGSAVDTFDVDAAVNDFLQGVTVDSGGTPIQVGVNAGIVETTAGDLTVLGAGELFLDDGNQTGSTWAQTGGIKLSETQAEWDAFETAFGEVSLLNAIVAAQSSAARTKVTAVVNTGAAVPADTNVTGSGGGANVDAVLPDYSTVTFLTDVDVFVNGQLQRNGANAAANHDVYPGDVATTGDLKFEYPLRGAPASKASVITVIVNGA